MILEVRCRRYYSSKLEQTPQILAGRAERIARTVPRRFNRIKI